MSVRQSIMKALEEAAESTVQASARAKPKGRKMPKQGKNYDVQDIYRGSMLSFEDTSGHRYKRYTLNGKSYMRRNDGIWYKPMREGTWSSMLTPPKGGEALHTGWQRAKGAAGAAGGAIALDQASRSFRK